VCDPVVARVEHRDPDPERVVHAVVSTATE
jgi:hypothetical protein